MPINIKTKIKEIVCHVYICVVEYNYIVIVVVAKMTMISSMNGHNQYWMTYDFSSIFLMKIQAIICYNCTCNYTLKPLPL